MTRLTAVLIGTAIFASVYGGAFANEHRAEPPRRIPIVYVVTKPVRVAVAQKRPMPKAARAYTAADLKPDQRTLYYALLTASCDAIRSCKP